MMVYNLLPTTTNGERSQLEQDLKTGALKGGDEDSVVVSRVLEVYLKPMQKTMLKVAPIMQLAGREARERARLLPSIMQVRVRLLIRFFCFTAYTPVATFVFAVWHLRERACMWVLALSGRRETTTSMYTFLPTL